MLKLFRQPLFWMVAAEMAVVSLLTVLAWNLVAEAARPALASPLIHWPAGAPEPARPGLPDVSSAGPDHRGPAPGLNLDSTFWRRELRELNRDQAYFEQLEWRIVHAAIDTMRRYLEAVVLPSIRHAEHAGGSLLG